jgi:hypothetical protein
MSKHSKEDENKALIADSALEKEPIYEESVINIKVSDKFEKKKTILNNFHFSSKDQN